MCINQPKYKILSIFLLWPFKGSDLQQMQVFESLGTGQVSQ